MHSPGPNHDFALKSDGTIVAWSNNAYGQLNLPVNITYTDIDAGEDFSIGLTESDSGNLLGQVTGMNSLTPGDYIAIAAGTTRADAIAHDGTIITKGEAWTGYTDLSLGPDYGFALREKAKEVVVTEPLSPGRSIRALDGTDVGIPLGSIIDHTHNDVARVILDNGTEYFWVNDRESTTVKFPSGEVLPVSLVHYISSGSTVDTKTPYRATVSSSLRANVGDVMTVKENAWYDEVNSTLPRAMCFADTGCSAGVTAKQQLFLSEPRTMSAGDIPVFSVHQTDNNTWAGTLSILDSIDAADSTSMIMEKNNVDPDQAINFSIISGKWGNETGTNVVLNAKANITPQRSHLHYTITGNASKTLASISLTSQIWKTSDAGDGTRLYRE